VDTARRRLAVEFGDLYYLGVVQITHKARGVAELVASDVVAGRLEPGDPVPSVRMLARRLGCAPGTAARAHAILRESGVTVGDPRSRAVVAAHGVASALAMGAHVGALRLSGSDDPALDVLLSAMGAGVERLGARGSVAGLRMLAEGTVDAAAVHLRDALTGSSNDVFTRRLLGGGAARLIHLWRRQQGIVVPRGNPSGIRGIADLDGARLAWRSPGTGSRLLLNRLLREADVVPAPADEVCDSHFGVAVAVAAGAVDAGLAVRAASEYVDVDFVPVEWEDFELALNPPAISLLGPLLEVLASPAVRRQITALGGYDLRRSGESRMAA
jgi:molybdate-binding protein